MTDYQTNINHHNITATRKKNGKPLQHAAIKPRYDNNIRPKFKVRTEKSLHLNLVSNFSIFVPKM